MEVAPKGARSIIYPSPKYRLTSMTVPIQRLCVYLPVEEQGPKAKESQDRQVEPEAEAQSEVISQQLPSSESRDDISVTSYTGASPTRAGKSQ